MSVVFPSPPAVSVQIVFLVGTLTFLFFFFGLIVSVFSGQLLKVYGFVKVVIDKY